MRLEEMAARALLSDRPRPALAFKGRWRNWGWMHDYASGVGAALRECGVPASAAIAFVPRNRPISAAALLSLIEQGRSIYMVYAFQAPEALAENLRRLEKRVLVISRGDFVGPVVEAAKSIRAGVVVLDEEIAEPFTAAGVTEEADNPAMESDAGIHVLTSGTTGAPKHFRLPYKVIAEQVTSAGLIFGKQADSGKAPTPTLTYFPFANISGLYHLLPVLMAGNPAILLEKFDIGAWLDYMKEYRPRVGSLPPPGVQMALEAGLTREDLEGTEFINTGAAAVDPTLHRAFEERFGITLLLSYGATEFGGPVAYFTTDLHRKWGNQKFGSVGPAWNGAALRVVNPQTGEVLPPNTEGILEVIAPRIGPDWIRTTDVAVLDEDGFLFHRGRADGAIMRGGFKLSPEVIEKALMLHPQVAAACVVGVPDTRLGQVPVGAIQLRSGETPPPPAELTAHLRKHVLPTQIPVAFRFVDKLPRTVSMKVDLRGVRALFDEGDRAPGYSPRQSQDQPS